MKIKEYLNISESSLTRVYNQMQLHDAGTITAFRSASHCNAGRKYTHNDNLKRNQSLLSKLHTKGYSVTRVLGTYIEDYGSDNPKEVGESVFLVVDIKDTGKLKKDLMVFGEEFEQDSILYAPKGSKKGYLIGTNKCENGYPGYHVSITLNNPIFGESGQFFTRVNGRPFTLKEDFKQIQSPMGYFGKWACYLMSKIDWNEIEK